MITDTSRYGNALIGRPADITRAAFALLVMLLGHCQAAYGQLMPYSHGDPTAYEQYMLELVNAARANPLAEAARSGIDLNQELAPGTITPTPKPPLAFHPQLIAAARAHSDWMLATQSFSHTGVNGSSPSQRAAAAGYAYGALENISYVGTSATIDLPTFTASSHLGLFRSAGHRTNLMDPINAVAGLGLRTGLFSGDYPVAPLLNTLMVTQKLSEGGASLDAGTFILGVAYRDHNGNRFYDPSEGVGSLTVSPSLGNYYATTSASGGYAIPLEPVEVRQDTVAVPLAIQSAAWEMVEPYESAYRSGQVAAAPLITVQITWRGAPLGASGYTGLVTVRRPVRINYRLTGTDGWFYERTMVTSKNVKHDLELSGALASAPVESFRTAGGWQAYLAANADVFNAGLHDEASAYAHWRDSGRAENRSFDAGRLRSDLPGGTTDPQYAIDGGFAWQYPDANGRKGNTVVFITQDAPKPAGWDGRALLLQKGDLFNLGPDYTAAAYGQLNPDVKQAIDRNLFPSFASVTDHYVKYGFKEGRLTNGNWTQGQLDAWNDNGYLTQNPDVGSFFQGAASEGWKLFGKVGFAHYINFGRTEGRGTGQ